MKRTFKAIAIIGVLLFAAYCAYLLETSDKKSPSEQRIGEWEVLWTDDIDEDVNLEELSKNENWVKSDNSNSAKDRGYSISAQWIRFQLPEHINADLPAFLIEKVYGYSIVIYVDNEKIFEFFGDYNYSVHSVLMPFSKASQGEFVYIGIESNTRIGIKDGVRISSFGDLQGSFIIKNIMELIVGSSLIFIAVIMLICSMFLNAKNIRSWLALCIIFLTSGTLVLTYVPFLYTLFSEYGRLFLTLFDISLFVLLPTFTYFFECIFGSGVFKAITRYRKFQIFYSLICTMLMLISQFDSTFLVFKIYNITTVTILGITMIIQLILLITVSTQYALKGNVEAIIFSMGFAIFAVMGIGELLWFYSNSRYYELFLWKWGVVCFLISLIIILGRRFARNHEQVVEYSKQLEVFNNELQRSEKMEILSELAASVAHEVRNPLQVTRGFIQLLAKKQKEDDILYLNMALDELDRASGIITDYLTFAKPEVGSIGILNLVDEFAHIEGILIPMANLQGGRITVDIPDKLYIKGSSSKFKQASINIIKNSIEALNGDGDIYIWAYREKNYIYVHFKDTGEGMTEEVLARLGEPYFTKKSKGTGLGLMVTFRIIEAMEGKIQFKSKQGAGTEVIIRFPAAEYTAEEEVIEQPSSHAPS